MFPKIYKRLGNKYYWFDIQEQVSERMDFKHEIKNGRFTFCKYSGTTPAAIHGSTLALNFFSETLVSMLKEQDVSLVDSYEIKTNESLILEERYFSLEITNSVPRIQNGNIFKEPNLQDYCAGNQIPSDYILDFDSSMTPFYAAMSKWDSSSIFTVMGTNHVLITELLVSKLEKKKFKNVVLKSLKFCN